MPPPRLLVFDLDGTLIDSTLDLCNSVNAMLAHFGKPALPNAVIAGYIGDGAAMLVRRALGDPGDFDSGDPTADAHPETLIREAVNFFIAWYREHKLDNTGLFPGVRSALETIRARHPHILMAVLTNKPVAPSREICTQLGIALFFFQNYGGNSFPTKKPDPEGLLTLIAEANTLLAARSEPPLTSDQVIFIGDSDVDIITARRCGARTLGCTFGIAPHTLTAAQPDALVHHASEWPAALGL